MGERRFMFVSDQDGHEFIIPADKKAEWEEWADLDPDDELAWEPPVFAQSIDGHEFYSFKDPRCE